MQKHHYRHFSSPDNMGFLDYVSVTLIDKTDGYDLKKWEDYPTNISTSDQRCFNIVDQR